MTLHIENLSAHYDLQFVLHHIHLTIQHQQQWVIRGQSGSGKTTLAKVIAKHIPYQGTLHTYYHPTSSLPPHALLIENWYRFTNLEGDSNFYYQQRYNHQQKKDTKTIAQELEQYGQQHQLHTNKLNPLLSTFNYTHLLREQLFEISSGEHKKLQLIKALWLQPQLLILDQPYTGLDAASRKNLNQLLNNYAAQSGTLILLCNDDELPSCITHTATLHEGKLLPHHTHFTAKEKPSKPLPGFLKAPINYTSHNLICMKNVQVKYDEKQVLSNINWEVNAGEKWLLQGHNGSGKSTLLSLITADHPQAYANNITLFGVKRGGGESIWDIKKRIGLISPELHWYFDVRATVWQSIASGFFDANGLYAQLRYTQKQHLIELLHFLDLYEIKDKLLSTLPLGQQRLALLGRTIIKNPQLLVLDEPCQGLDMQQTRFFNHLVDEISINGVTIIYVGHFETQIPSCITHKLVLENGQIKNNNT